MARRVRELSDEQKALVAAVKRIAKKRARINADYVAAILEAREHGVTYASIARAVGTSSQAVQEIVRRHRTPTDTAAAVAESSAPALRAVPSADAGSSAEERAAVEKRMERDEILPQNSVGSIAAAIPGSPPAEQQEKR